MLIEVGKNFERKLEEIFLIISQRFTTKFKQNAYSNWSMSKTLQTFIVI